MTQTLTEIELQIAWIADCLIPADPKTSMPSALQAGLIERLLPRALKERDDMAQDFVTTVLRLPEIAPANPLQALRDLGPDAFSLISFLIAGAYLLDPEVNRRLRYPGQEALVESPDYDEIIETVDRVQARGPRYIPTPSGAA